MRRYLVLVIILLTLPAFTNAKVKGYYRVNLESVDINDSDIGIISNPENSVGFATPVYSDSTIYILFTFEPTHIDFILQNKTNSNIKIIWDEAIYVGGLAGASNGVFHKGVKFTDREQTQMPTVIVKGSKISDLLVVKDYVSFNNYFNRWMYHYILHWEDQLTEAKVLLPIEVNGEKREYLFIFSVKWEDIKVKTRFYGGKEYYIEKK